MAANSSGPPRKMVQVRYGGKLLASNSRLVGKKISEVFEMYKGKISGACVPFLNRVIVKNWDYKLTAFDTLSFTKTATVVIGEEVLVCLPIQVVGLTPLVAYGLLVDAGCDIDQMSAVKLNGKNLSVDQVEKVRLKSTDHLEFVLPRVLSGEVHTPELTMIRVTSSDRVLALEKSRVVWYGQKLFKWLKGDKNE